VYASVLNKGYFKYGLKDSAKVKMGLPYATHEENITGLRPLCVVGDKIYVRDTENQQNPLIVLDKNTLEPLPEDQAVKNLNKNKRNFEEDDWNRPIFEVTDDQKLRNLITKSARGSFRCLTTSPIIFDGTHILVISTHYVINETERESIDYQTMEKFFTIEMYHPETMNYAGSIKLDLNMETDGKPNDLDQTQLEDLEELKEHIYDRKPASVVLAHNKRNIIIAYEKNMFVFDYSTGKRISDKIKLAHVPLSFNTHSSEFWSIDMLADDFTFSTYKVSGFGAKAESKTIQNITSLFDTKSKEIAGQIESGTTKVPKRSTLNMLKGLSKSKSLYKNSKEAEQESKPIDYTLASFCLLEKVLDG
jgi:hypothetical protein